MISITSNFRSENSFENWLKTHNKMCITGIDTGDDGPLQSRYNLHSMELRHKIEVIISLDRNNPKVESIEQIWRIGDWFERETFDMLGIEYTGHRDLRRILLPDDWEGWPLRKDYQVQETYHGIVVAFAVKGSSLYFAKMTLQKAGMQMQKELQLQIMNSILQKHTGQHYLMVQM